MDLLGFAVPSWIIYLLFILVTLYMYYTWRFGEFRALGLKHPKPVPVFGTMFQSMKLGLFNSNQYFIKKYGRIHGRFMGRNPVILIAEPELVKKILIKDFSNFSDHQHLPLRGLLKHSLVDVHGAAWRRMRALLSPAFSTGKLKQMEESIRYCASNLRKYVGQMCEKDQEFEAKDFASAFSMDVLTMTTYGVEIDVQSDRNNPIFKYAKELVDVQFTNPWVLLIILAPGIANLLDKLNVSAFPKRVEKFYRKMLNDIIDERAANPTQERPDFIQMMLKAEQLLKDQQSEEVQQPDQGTLKGMTRDEILSQCFIFFLAGFDTVGSSLSFMMYNLAVHPEVQDKVIKEIDEVMAGSENPTYDLVSKMNYLEQCFCESARLFPSLSQTDRLCNKEMQYPEVTIPKGMVVTIPIVALQKDPEYWPEPEVFNPDRFSPENKDKIHPMTYLPFGLGPRQCIGMRFAQLEMKIAIVMILQKYKLVTCEKTQIPLVLKKGFFAQAEKGLWMKARQR